MTDITQESLQKKQEAIDLLAKRYRGLEQRTEDIVTLALYGDQPDSKDYMSEVYRAIGQRVYDWLLEVAMAEHCDHWVSTGAHFDITATLTGRPMR